MIKLSKEEKKPESVFIDFAKTFDTVSLKHIWEVLSRKGVNKLIRVLKKLQ